MDMEIVSAGMAVFVMIVVEYFYLRDTLHNKIKPHMFSWFIWGTLMSISGAVQYAEGAVFAASATIFGGLMCYLISLAAYFRGARDIDVFDWMCFVCALCAIPIWVVMNDPLYAALLITLIDLMGFLPTYRVTWKNPGNEQKTMYMSSAITDLMICLSLSPLTLASCLYPLSGLVTNSTVVALIILRTAFLAQKRKRHIVYRFYNGLIRTEPYQGRVPLYGWSSEAATVPLYISAQRPHRLSN
jgi:hypothetical protein